MPNRKFRSARKPWRCLYVSSLPGNVRELDNIIQTLIIMCETNIDEHHLPDHLKYLQPKYSGSLTSLQEAEKSHILKVASVGNIINKAAEMLIINRKTLRKKLQQT